MKIRDLKEWCNQQSEEDLETPLTPYLLMRVVEPKLAERYVGFASWVFLFSPDEGLRDEAIKLIVLFHIPLEA